MIKHYSLKILQKAINKAVALDDSMPAQFEPLAGKVIELLIVPLQVKFFITFQQREIILWDQYDGLPDTVIQSSPLGLIRLSLLPVSKARSLFHDEIQLTGDIELGQQVKKIFDGMDIDWEGHLAHFTGDVVAYQFGSLFRRGLALKQQITDSFCDNVGEYLQEELRMLPPAEEISDFFDDIDRIAQDTERLEAQINWLNAAHENR
jgi:ubiquinone biosynthesis protein UbiJ